MNFAYPAGCQAIQFLGQPILKTIDQSQTFFPSHRILTKSEHSHPQFPRTTLGMPGTMTPLLATKYDDHSNGRLTFLDLGFPTEA